jgi:radical SAM superfamily enzyme YgiQ (UPF0313 family)
MIKDNNFLPINGEINKDDELKKKRVVLLSGTQMERSIRHLAGLVKEYLKDDYEVDILNLGAKAGMYEQKDGGYPEDLRKEVVEFILDKKPELIGISLMDYGMERTSELIKEISWNDEIRKIGTKIVAGGPFAIEHSERCLNIEGVDAVCYTKGWHFAEIVKACANGDNLENIPGLIIKTGVNQEGKAECIKTPPPNLRVTLSEQPLPDESLDNTYRIYKGHIVNVAESGGAIPVEHHQVAHKHTGVLITSEGCVNDCKFCSIPTQRKIMEGQVKYKLQKINFLEADKAVALIENYLKDNPNTEYILFNDNDFTGRSVAKIEEFSKLYKERIGLPFYCQCSPNTASKEKIKLLREAGMDTFDTGVQGSEQSNKAAGYERACTDENILDIAKGVSPFLEKRNSKGEVTDDGMKAAFDFINGNEVHTKEDMLSTMELIKNITKTIKNETSDCGSWNLAIHNLTLDADRELAQEYKKIKMAQGISVGEVEDSDYHNAAVEAFYKLKEPYLNILLECMGGLHDQVKTGRLPRQASNFVLLIGEILEKDEKLSGLIRSKIESKTETVDLLTDEEIYGYLGDKNNARSKEILKLINAKIPEINYSYHRPDRYDFDYSWADKQVAGK